MAVHLPVLAAARSDVGADGFCSGGKELPESIPSDFIFSLLSHHHFSADVLGLLDVLETNVKHNAICLARERKRESGHTQPSLME